MGFKANRFIIILYRIFYRIFIPVWPCFTFGFGIPTVNIGLCIIRIEPQSFIIIRDLFFILFRRTFDRFKMKNLIAIRYCEQN